MMEMMLVAATAGCLMAALAWYVRGLRFQAERSSLDTRLVLVDQSLLERTREFDSFSED